MRIVPTGLCLLTLLIIPNLFSTSHTILDIGNLSTNDNLGVEDTNQMLDPHEPIIISGNTDFESQAASEGWHGNGTEENPYIIENLEIVTPVTCVNISHTTVYFTIRNCFLNSTSQIGEPLHENYYEIMFNNVNHGTIIHCSTFGYGRGVIFENSNNCNLINSTVTTAGVLLFRSKMCTISNCTITAISILGSEKCVISQSIIYESSCSYSAVLLKGASYCVVFNNTVSTFKGSIWSRCPTTGICVAESNHCIISNNTIFNNTYGMRVVISTNCTITTNYYFDNIVGIKLEEALLCQIIENIFIECGLLITGENLDYWNHDLVDNTVNGKPLLHISRKSNISINGGVFGQIIISGCFNVSISNVIFSHGFVGILIGFSTNCSIDESEFHYNTYGIYIIHSEGCIVTNTIFKQNSVGLELSNLNNIRILNNSLHRNGDGILSENCLRFVLSTNILDNNSFGAVLDYPVDSWIECNTVYNNRIGGISLRNAVNCMITHNLFLNNCYHTFGFYALNLEEKSHNNQIYENMFGNNTVEGEILHAIDDGYNNTWDNGIDRGNSWSDYSGFGNQSIPGDAGSVDRFPARLNDTLINGITLYQSPIEPLETDYVTIEVEITYRCLVDEVILSYSIDEGISWQNSTMQWNGTTWTTNISMQPAGISVKYIVYVSFKIKTWITTRKFSYDVLAVPPNYSLIVSILVAIGIIAILVIYKQIRK